MHAFLQNNHKRAGLHKKKMHWAEFVSAARSRGPHCEWLNFSWRVELLKSAYHDFGPGADIPAGWLFRNVDLQVAVRRGEPPGSLPLLFLCHELKGAAQTWVTIVRRHRRHRGGDFHVVLGTGLLTDNGVPIRVACSVSLSGCVKRGQQMTKLWCENGTIYITQAWELHSKIFKMQTIHKPQNIHFRLAFKYLNRPKHKQTEMPQETGKKLVNHYKKVCLL